MHKVDWREFFEGAKLGLIMIGLLIGSVVAATLFVVLVTIVHSIVIFIITYRVAIVFLLAVASVGYMLALWRRWNDSFYIAIGGLVLFFWGLILYFVW